MDTDVIAKDLVVAYIAKKGPPSKKDVGQAAKDLVAFYKATKNALAEPGDTSSVYAGGERTKPDW